MARAVISTKDKKRVSREGGHVQAFVGVVSGNEYYELCVNAYDATDTSPGMIVVTKISSKDSNPKEVYRVPASKKVRKAAPKEQEGTASA